GIVASGITFTVQIWCIDRGGPVFVAVYQPVQTLVTAVMASFLLGEEFYLGGIIGAALVIAGLYFVLWGKNEETRLGAGIVVPSTADHGNNGVTTQIEPSITQPLLPESTD
ncbi:hypothetical protein M569_16659, partial [Genlisea aurea]